MPLKRGAVRIATAVAATCIAQAAAASEPTKLECVASNESAQQQRSAGKLHEARSSLATCMAAECPGLVREDCAERLREVDGAMPTVVFAAKDGSGKDLSRVRVTIDGRPLVERLDGTAVAVDPGEHHFAFTADGGLAGDVTLVAREAEKERHVAVVLATPPGDGDLASSPPNESKSPDGGSQRAVGIAIGGTGIAAAIAGTVLALVSKATYDNALATQCGNDPQNCSAQGEADGRTARTQATGSTAAFVAAGALIGAGAIVYATAPSGRAMRLGPMVGARSAGLGVTGTW